MTTFYGYIYKITIPTSEGLRYYWGQHKYNCYPNIDSRYWGSGKLIRDWIKKHLDIHKISKDLNPELAKQLNLSQTIVCWCETKEELDLKEKSILNKHLDKKYCWNLAPGGTGGAVCGEHGHEVTAATKAKIAAKHHGLKMWTNGKINVKSKECPGRAFKLGMTRDPIVEKKRRLAISQSNMNKPKSKKHKEALKAAAQKRCKQIKCIETGEVFKSSVEAVKKYHIKHNNISGCCLGRAKTCGGYHWARV